MVVKASQQTAKPLAKKLNRPLPIVLVLIAIVLAVVILLMYTPQNAGPSCGDAMCNGAETCSSCQSDCGACPPACGDGSCNAREDCLTCSQDCGECGSEAQTQLDQWLPGRPCNFVATENVSTDGQAYQYAVENNMLEACDCIEDNATKNRCRTVLLDLLYYTRAVNMFDLAGCELVNDSVAKDACKLVVTSGIDYLNENDKFFLAEAYIKDKEWDKAISLLETILAENPNDAEMLTDISATYSELGMTSYKTQEYMPKALDAINKAWAVATQNMNGGAEGGQDFNQQGGSGEKPGGGDGKADVTDVDFEEVK